MNKQLFSPEQIEQQQQNPHVLKVSERTIQLCYQWNVKKMAPVQYRNHLLAS